MTSTLGTNIKRIREMHNISAYELAKKAAVGAATISEIENGKRQTLQGNTINKIANALNVSVNDLLSDGETINFETNDICDLLSIILSSESIELDKVKLSHEEKILLETDITMFISAIRYKRLKDGR